MLPFEERFSSSASDESRVTKSFALVRSDICHATDDAATAVVAVLWQKWGRWGWNSGSIAPPSQVKTRERFAEQFWRVWTKATDRPIDGPSFQIECGVLKLLRLSEAAVISAGGGNVWRGI